MKIKIRLIKKRKEKKNEAITQTIGCPFLPISLIFS